MAAKAIAISKKDVLAQVQPMIESVAGFILGNLAVTGVNTLAGKVLPASIAQKGIVKVLPPLTVSAGAIIGATKVKQPMLQNVLKGVAIAGAYKAAQAVMPNASFLHGDGLGLTPVSAMSNPDRWLYHESTPISGMGFPNLGAIQPPESGSGYYLDPPAYMQGAEESNEQMPQQNYFRGATEEQFYGGGDEDLNGPNEEQFYGGEDMEIL